MNKPARPPQPTPGTWICAPTQQTMHDGDVLPTYGVEVAESGQWVGRVHPIGPTEEDHAMARCNARLFAASKAMAGLLEKASATLAEVLATMHDKDGSMQAADLAAWFAVWQANVSGVIGRSGRPATNAVHTAADVS